MAGHSPEGFECLFVFVFVATVVNVPNILSSLDKLHHHFVYDYHSLFEGIVYFIEHFYNCVHKM